MHTVERKAVIIGDYCCGKTALLYAFETGNHTPDPWLILPRSVYERKKAIDLDGTKVLLSVWDSCEYEDYHRLRQYTYSKTDVVLIAFAIDRPSSLRSVLIKWGPEIKKWFPPGIPFFVLGCKADIRTYGRRLSHCIIQPSEGEAVAAEIGAWGYLECSAYDGTVDRVLEMATKACLSRKGRRESMVKGCTVC